MSELTHSSMRDARDAEDNRLLQDGEIDLLLAGWVETIDVRCVAKMRGPVGHGWPSEDADEQRGFGSAPLVVAVVGTRGIEEAVLDKCGARLAR